MSDTTISQTTQGTNEYGEVMFGGHSAKEVADLCDMLAAAADRMQTSYSETASIARRARDAIRYLLEN